MKTYCRGLFQQEQKIAMINAPRMKEAVMNREKWSGFETTLTKFVSLAYWLITLCESWYVSPQLNVICVLRSAIRCWKSFNEFRRLSGSDASGSPDPKWSAHSLPGQNPISGWVVLRCESEVTLLVDEAIVGCGLFEYDLMISRYWNIFSQNVKGSAFR